MPNPPTVVILAGINGAGKTTSSRPVVAETYGIKTFVNADVVAQGLSGFDPAPVAAKAGQIVLEWVRELGGRRADFAFETTIAGRTHAVWLRTLREAGYDVRLHYYWLDSPELAVARVAARVRIGGHHIPEETIRQRYPRTVGNFFELYRPLASRWFVYDNSGSETRLVADGAPARTAVHDGTTWARMRRIAGLGDEPADAVGDEAETSRMTDAVNRGIRRALTAHAREGFSVPVSRDGRVEWMTPG